MISGTTQCLTQMVNLCGCSCKLPEIELESLLCSAGISIPANILGPGDDAAVIKINDNVALVLTVDFFTPIVDNPYTQGKIAACNCTNDIFAMGITNVTGVLAILGIPRQLNMEASRDMLRGFQDFCYDINTTIVGGHTIVNPWPIIGGSVTAVADPKEIIYNSGARPGDTLILTKPLGIQPAMAAARISDEFKEILDSTVSPDIVADSVSLAVEIMTTSNLKAAEAVKEIGVNALTDVTGFGLYGHARNIAEKSHVTIDINTIPVIRGTTQLSNLFGYGLEIGKSPETAGGLLISVSSDKKDDLIQALSQRNVPSYEIGTVRKDVGYKIAIKDPEIIEISSLKVNEY
jgi:selenide,water dikinase